MKRFHVHVAVDDLDKSIAFYSAMFGADPSVVKPDYAKWMLEDPRVNFAISNRGQTPGVNHLGMQAEDDAELETIHANLQRAGSVVVPEKGVHCCYAESDKYWVTDPQGVAWESFRSLGSIPLFGSEDAQLAQQASLCGSSETTASSCCAPGEAKPGMHMQPVGGCCATA
jgi:catechol 2,3-dioxygenase-like lactoylglutathione lyase family enzyme